MANDKKIIKKHSKIAEQIIALENNMEKLKDEEFKIKTQEFKDRIQNGETLDDILVEAYALVREASFRTLKMKAYKVQLIGAIILHQGDIAEMRTGEGKTLTGIFPAYLNSLTGKGVHIVTVNEYLSERDSELNGQVFSLLGITVGLNRRDISRPQKKVAYLQDVTYTTNSELGFDYLRDNMVFDLSQKVQRKLNYAIIDEADSILIDEARTPLIISGGSQNRTNLYKMADSFAQTLKDEVHVGSDLESKQVFLTDLGIIEAEKFFSIKNLFENSNAELFHLIMNALKAQFTFKNGVEYTVKDNEIVLIDQFTGRVMPGRSYSDGLQQALQAKEGVKIDEETQTVATITYQNFYRLYSKLSGMTGTAKTEEEEFIKIYNTRVIVCPTNQPIIRKDLPDLVFATTNGKINHMIEKIKEINSIGRPILIGTTSVESSEQVSRYLEKAGFNFEMINAKNHHREAEIVEKAGQKGAITLATNMAGRGTDIKLTQETRELGGLFVFGVDRNEARRIDNQLRGRGGRQGDPGTSMFYISMQDELMVRFTHQRLRQRFLKVLGETDFLDSRMFTRAVTNAQKKLEGLNFDQRKNILDYDNVLSQHREMIYSQRDNILESSDLKIVLSKFHYTIAYELIMKNSEIILGEKTLNGEKYIESLNDKYIASGAISPTDFLSKEKHEIATLVQKNMMDFYITKISDVPADVAIQMERRNIIESFDHFWTRHINLSQKLRTGIYLQQYAQNNPLQEYISESADLFNRMKIDIAFASVDKLNGSVIKNVSPADIQMRSTQQPRVNITEKDIDGILAEWGMSKETFSKPNVEAKLIELKDKYREDQVATRKLIIQSQIIQGLMNELDKIAMAQKNHKVNLTQKDMDIIVDKFGLKGKKFTQDDVKKSFDEMAKNVTQEELTNLIIEAQVLSALTIELDKLEENKKAKEFEVTNSEGKKQKIKLNDDGQVDPDDIPENEDSTQVKIG